MLTVPENVRQRLRQHGQEHVVSWWDRLNDQQRRELLAQVERLDLEHLRRLHAQRDHSYAVPAADRIGPVPVTPRDSPDNAARQRQGEDLLRRGEVAALVVAGGQGSRLGFEHPKGMFAIGPVSGKSLFQIHAEKVLALSRRYRKKMPFLVMTSPATDEETTDYFAQNQNFGLDADQVIFFRQGTMPALDLATGKLLLEAPGRLFLSPDGHGGTLTALADTGLLDRLRQHGIRHVFYFQVDNPLVKVADPVFLGHHLAARSELSSKVVAKLGPTDKMGNFVQVDGRCAMIEYSDLPEQLARQTDEQGRLRIWAGNPAIHIFDLDFLTRVTGAASRTPFHVARKKVPHLDEAGNTVQPEKENALKFERFIFDVLPLADRWVLVETTRHDEFAPLKNAAGADSPDAVKAAITDLAAAWLAQAGVVVPRGPDGAPAFPLEISPLFALDVAELARRVMPGTRVDGPTYWS